MSSKPIEVGLIGFGYWGRKLFAELQADGRFIVSTIMTRRRETVGPVTPSVAWTDSLDQIAVDPRIDAVVIATPVPTHREIGGRMLAAGKHLFMEKTLAATGAQARELQQIAQLNGCRIFVDYTFSVLPGVERMRQLVATGEIGVVEAGHLSMSQLGRFNDMDVYNLLASHMLSVLQVICPLDRLDVARRDLVARDGVVETGVILFNAMSSTQPYVSNRLLGTIDVSLNHVMKVRQIVLYGTGGSLSYDMTDGGRITVVRYEVRRDRSAKPVGPQTHTDAEFANERGLQSALSAFYDLLQGRRSSNLDSAVAVNEALDRLSVEPSDGALR
jgi:predicted dehydrogenase